MLWEIFAKYKTLKFCSFTPFSGMMDGVTVPMEDTTYYDDNIKTSTQANEDDVQTLASSYLMYKIGKLFFV